MSKTYAVTAVRTRTTDAMGLTWYSHEQLPYKCVIAATKSDAVRLAAQLYGGKGLNISVEEV